MSWVEESEKRLLNQERALAKLVMTLFEQNPDYVPASLHAACVNALTAREILDDARKKQPRLSG